MVEHARLLEDVLVQKDGRDQIVEVVSSSATVMEPIYIAILHEHNNANKRC